MCERGGGRERGRERERERERERGGSWSDHPPSIADITVCTQHLPHTMKHNPGCQFTHGSQATEYH